MPLELTWGPLKAIGGHFGSTKGHEGALGVQKSASAALARHARHVGGRRGRPRAMLIGWSGGVQRTDMSADAIAQPNVVCQRRQPSGKKFVSEDNANNFWAKNG